MFNLSFPAACASRKCTEHPFGLTKFEILNHKWFRGCATVIKPDDVVGVLTAFQIVRALDIEVIPHLRYGMRLNKPFRMLVFRVDDVESFEWKTINVLVDKYFLSEDILETFHVWKSDI